MNGMTDEDNLEMLKRANENLGRLLEIAGLEVIQATNSGFCVKKVKNNEVNSGISPILALARAIYLY